jgi:hypothetical protein
VLCLRKVQRWDAVGLLNDECYDYK